MVYIENGAVVRKRSPWRLSIIVDVFMSFVAMLTVFFRTIFDPAANSQVRASGRSSRASSSSSGRPGRGGGRSGGRIVGLDTLNKADHNARCGGGG